MATPDRIDTGLMSDDRHRLLGRPNPLEQFLIDRGFEVVLPGDPPTVVAKDNDPVLSVRMNVSAWRSFLRSSRERTWWAISGGFCFGMLVGYLWHGWFS